MSRTHTNKTIVLRFRDLVTTPGGTIDEHKKLISQQGAVWWGWWMRQYEVQPLREFEELTTRLTTKTVNIYLFDAGLGKIYSADLQKIVCALPGEIIETPYQAHTPSYYHQVKCPAWFLLVTIREGAWDVLHLYYDSFPTLPGDASEWEELAGHRVSSVQELRDSNVTLWVVQERSR